MGDGVGALARKGVLTLAMMTTVPFWTVRLPEHVRAPFAVYVNGVRQQEDVDYRVQGRDLLFERPLVKEGRLGFWRWFLGAWGIGTYRRNDQVDVTWDAGGRPRVAHALDITPPAE